MSRIPSNTVSNIHVWGIKCIVSIILFIPLYVSSSVMFPYVTGKNFAFRILVEIAAALWLGLLFVNKEYRLKNTLIVSSVLVFTFVVGLADLFGINPYNSFWSNYERMEGYITILHLTLFFLIIKSVFRTRKDWIIFFSICITVSMLVSLQVLFEPISFTKTADYIREYGTRRAGTIGNPPFLASYMLLSVFICIILGHMAQKQYQKLFCLFMVVLNSITIYLTASRGAILAAVVGAVIIGVFMQYKKSKKPDMMSINKRILFILALLAIVSIGFFAFYNVDFMDDDSVAARFMRIPRGDTSISTRLYVWKMAWNGFNEHPLLGWGQENYFGIYTVNPVPSKGFKWIDRAHNIVVHWLINAGALGLISYLSIFVAAFYTLREKLRKEIISRNKAIIIVAMCIAYFIQNLFTFDTISSYMLFFTLLAYIDNIESEKKVPYNISTDTVNSKKTNIMLVCITLFSMLFFVSLSYVVNYIPLKQLQLFSKIGHTLSKYDSYSTMLNDFDKALSYRSFGDNYIREEMQSASYQIIDYQLYNKEGASKFISRAIEESEKWLATNPYNLEFIKKAVYFYRLLAMYEPSFVTVAEKLIEKCMHINPQYQRLEMAKVDVLIIKKDYEKAFHHVKKIAELNPGNLEAQFKLALTAILTSRDEIINKALENAKKIRDAGYKDVPADKKTYSSVRKLYQLAQAYMEVKNYNSAIHYYREIITVLPDDKIFYTLKIEDKLNAQARFHLEIAKTYVLLGDREHAVKEAEKAEDLAPGSFSEIVKKIID